MKTESQRCSEKCAKEGGFTLMELMVVIVILGVLAGLVVPKIMDEPHKARVVKARLQMEQFGVALESFRMDNGFYPTTEQGLEALVAKPEFGREARNYRKGGYFARFPKDPWGVEYIYATPGKHGSYDIVSYGADGQAGGQDDDADINNWETK